MIAGLGATIAVTVAGAWHVDGTAVLTSAALALAPMLTSMLTDKAVRVLGIGLVAVVSAWCLGWLDGQGPVLVQDVRLALVALVAGVGYLVARIRQRDRADLVTLGEVARSAQRAIMNPTAPNPDGMSAELRYYSASEAALIGGDAYECAETDYGLRLLVADARGKGMKAVRSACLALGAFREWAHVERDLGQVLTRMDDSLRRELDDSDFVTALVAQIDGTELALCLAGHPCPLLLRDGQVLNLYSEPSPPLSVSHEAYDPAVSRFDLYEGDVLFLFTDGLIEARDPQGRFFDLECRLPHVARKAEDLTQLVDALIEELREHVRGKLRDDLVLVALALHSAPAARADAEQPQHGIPAAPPQGSG